MQTANIKRGQRIFVTKDTGEKVSATYAGTEERDGSQWLRMTLNNGNIYVLREDRILTLDTEIDTMAFEANEATKTFKKVYGTYILADSSFPGVENV